MMKIGRWGGTAQMGPHPSSFLLAAVFLSVVLFAPRDFQSRLRVRVSARHFDGDFRSFRFLLEHGVERFQEYGLQSTPTHFGKLRVGFKRSVKVDFFVQQIKGTVHIGNRSGNTERYIG